jgi:hypothetical protein
MVIAGLLISSSSLLVVEQPKYLGYPIVSAAGFVIAIFLMLYLAASILNEKKQEAREK